MTARTPSTLCEAEVDDEASRDRTIWLAVIAQSLEDATAQKTMIKPAHRAQARAWLTCMSSDFREVCSLAGLEPDSVRKHAERAISEVDAGKSCARRRPAHKAATTSPTNGRRSIAGMTLTHGGRTLTLKEWAEALGLAPHVIRSRVQYGWPTERILTEPVDVTRRKRSTLQDRGVGRASSHHAGTGALPTAQISA